MGRMNGAGFQISEFMLMTLPSSFGGQSGSLTASARMRFPLLQAVVAPNVDDLVERPDFRVPESGQGRVFLPGGQRHLEGILHGGQGFQA